MIDWLIDCNGTSTRLGLFYAKNLWNHCTFILILFVFLFHKGFLFIWYIDESLKGATTMDLSGPGSNGNEDLRAGASPSDAVLFHTRDTISILTINSILTGTTTPNQSEPGRNVNERALHTPKISFKTGVSPSDEVLCYIHMGIFINSSYCKKLQCQTKEILVNNNKMLIWVFLFYQQQHPNESCPISWGCRIHWLHLCRWVRAPLTTSVLNMTLNNQMMKLQ